ncbi:hypothetical protein ACP6JC_005787 [Aspergillus fumigatus]
MELRPHRADDDILETPVPAKADINLVESIETGIPSKHADIVASRLSRSHRDFLMEHHGTLDLDPIPSMDLADPYNWPAWKKMANLILVAFHACMGTFAASGIIPGYSIIAEDFGVSINKASYLTSLQIAILGGAPLFWKPLSQRYGRRPIFLLSLTCSCVSIGSAIVMETTFKKDRAKYMGIWTLMVTVGIPCGPFIFGFVAHRAGYVWIYWVLAMINGGQFILYLFFGPETRYIGGDENPKEPAWKREYLSLRRIDLTPFMWYEFVKPLTMVMQPCIAIPAAAYAMVFCLSNVLATVEVPTLLERRWGLNPEQLGLQFLGPIIGSVLGEQLGGRMSDLWMRQRERKTRKRPEPEYRLWLSYIGYFLSIVGLIVFLVCTQLSGNRWEVAPIIGIAIGAAGNQVVTTVLITFAVDCYPEEAGSVGVFITFVRQIWGFLGPFW